MDIAKKQISKNRVKFIVNVSSAMMSDFFENEFLKLLPSVSLPGFRPGKVPRVMAIEAIGQNRIVSLAVEKALDEGYKKALIEHKLYPVSQPAVSIIKHPSFIEGADNKLEYEVEFDILPEAKIGDYKKIKVEKFDEKKIVVTEDEVDRVINYLVRQASSLEEKDGKLQEGDWAEINFFGEINKIKKDILSSNNFPMVVGETKMVDGFTKQIIGTKKGETKEFEIKMPKDLPDKEIADKKVNFKVEILNIKKIIKPKIDNKFAEKFGHKNPLELKKAIKASLVAEKKENELQKINAKISEQVIKLTKVEIPKSLIDSEVVRLKQSMEEGLKKQGLTYEKYLADSKVDPAKAQKDLENQAKMNITLGVGLSEIAKKEKVEISSKEGMQKVYDKIIDICAK